MNTDSILKKEGIVILEELTTLQVNNMANAITSKLCKTFPEHNLNINDLFTAISRINMYIVDMGTDLSAAKYYYKNNSIYFNKNISLDSLADVAVHECIHVIQEIRDEHDEIVRMGLYDGPVGIGINEATVQLMASETNGAKPVQEKYFNISLQTTSPNYYPLECALVSQLTHFTGTYPLYHSTLFNNDIFKNTLITRSDKRTYNTIIKNLDKLLHTEEELNFFANEVLYEQRASNIKVLNKLSEKKKNSIISLFFKTQNLIMKSLFSYDFNSIKNLSDVKDFQTRLYNYKELIGSSDNYTFYHDFYVEMMETLEVKKEYIENYGEINLFNVADKELLVISNAKNSFSFFLTLIKKIKKLLDGNKDTVNVNDL